MRLTEARPDPQGRNPKAGRMYVVINPPDSIANGDELDLVAITSEIKNTGDEVVLPYANPGSSALSMTKLTKKSVAQCSWREKAEQAEIEITDGFVPPKVLLQILKKLAESEDLATE